MNDFIQFYIDMQFNYDESVNSPQKFKYSIDRKNSSPSSIIEKLLIFKELFMQAFLIIKYVF